MLANNKIDKVIIILLAAAVIFTGVFMFAPNIIGISAKAASPAYLAKLFDKDKVAVIEIEADADDWQEMLDNAVSEEYISCDITINGEKYYKVGIRPKGNSSLSMVAASPDTDRYSFKIKMDEYVDGQSYYGLSKFVANNMQGDATYMKEYLSYDMFEFMGVNTPAYAFADIKVNGEAWGLYLAVEAVEQEWAARTYGSGYGELYKPESTDMGGGAGFGRGGFEGGEDREERRTIPQGEQARQNRQELQGEAEAPNDFPHEDFSGFGGFGSGGGADLVYTDDEIESYDQIFDEAVFGSTNDSDKKRVIKAIKVLNTSESTEELEKYIDTDEVLRCFAVNTALVNLDSYICSFKHNYYLYEEDGRLSIIPWDLNLSFAGFQSGSASEAVNFPIDTPAASGIELDERPLIGKLLENEEYKETYHKYIEQIVSEYFDSGYFEKTIEKLENLISGYVENDATAFYSYEEFIAAVSTLKNFGSLRAQSLQGQLDGSVPSTWETQKENPQALINADSITLRDMGEQGGGGMPNAGMPGGRKFN